MKQRIEYIDLAKGFCILFVVLFHFCQIYGMYSNPSPLAKTLVNINNIIGVFRMPLYFFLSGCFFKSYDGFGNFLKKKINKLLIPFVFFYIVASFIIPNAFAYLGIKFEHSLPLSRIFIAWLFDFYPSSPIWFLLCLFEIGIIFYGVYSLSKKFHHEYIALVLFSIGIGIIGISFGLLEITLPAQLGTALTNIPYYMAGYLLFRKTRLFSPNKFDKYSYIFILFAFAIDAAILPQINVFSNRFVGFSWLTMYPCGLMGVLGIILLAKKLKYLPIISYFGRYSIIILTTHITLLFSFAIIVDKMPLSSYWHLLINITLTILSFFIVIPFARKYLSYVTAQKDLIK